MPNQVVVFNSKRHTLGNLPQSVTLSLQLGQTGNLRTFVAPFPRIAPGMKIASDNRSVMAGVKVVARDNNTISNPPMHVEFTSRDVGVLDAVLLGSFLDRFRGFSNVTFNDTNSLVNLRGAVTRWSYSTRSDDTKRLSALEYEQLYDLVNDVLNPKLEAETLVVTESGFGVTDPVTYVLPAVAYNMFPFDWNDGSPETVKRLRTTVYDFQVTFEGY